jgi:hypothetical protein
LYRLPDRRAANRSHGRFDRLNVTWRFATAGRLEDNAHRLNKDISAFKRTGCP